MKKSIQAFLVLPCLAASTSVAWAASQFTSDFNSGVAPGSFVVGSAFVDNSGGIANSGVLKLTVNATSQSGGYVIEDFNGGNPVNTFKAVARVAIGGGTSRPADGMSLSFGTDVAFGTGGEEGEGTGLIVSLDTWDNAVPDTAPAFELKYGGAVVAFQSMAGIREGGRAPDGPILIDLGGNPVTLETFGPVPAAPADSSFVNLVVELFADNTVSVGWSNVAVFNHVPIPYTPLSGARFALGARTGGATDDHWVDNLAILVNYTAAPVSIVSEPADQVVTEGQRAPFSVAVNGTPPYRVQWFKNNVAIPGANELIYTTPPTTLADSGSIYRAEIRNAETPTPLATRNATLTVQGVLFVQSVSVQPCDNKRILLRYNKPAALTGSYSLNGGGGQVIDSASYGADHSQVVLETEPLTPDTPFILGITGETGEDGSVLVPDPSAVTFSYGFGRFCADFNDGLLPPGTISSGTIPPYVGAEGALHLSDQGQNGNLNYWTIPLSESRTLDRLQVSWKTKLTGLGGADGFSFSAGSSLNIPLPEEGGNNGLAVNVDTFDNGGGEVGCEVRWNGARLAFTPVGGGTVNGPPELMRDQFVDAFVEVTPTGFVTFKYDTFVVTAQIPAFAGMSVNQYVFAARTGGANENCWIDDLCINGFEPGPPTIAAGPNNLTVPAGSTATFAVSGVRGTPPITYQWLRNGVPIAGATGPSYSFTTVAADNGSKYSVRLVNDCGPVTSPEATLGVLIAPVILNCSSRGNCHAIYVTYNKPVLLDGSYTVACSNTIPAVGTLVKAEDFNAGGGGFTVNTPLPYDGPWTYDAGSGSWTQAGQGPDSTHPNTSTLISPPIILPQAGVVQLTFAHRYSFEQDAGTVGWDGGQVRVSVNGGAFIAVAAGAFTQNGYSGTVRANSTSELHGQAAFVINSPNFAGGTITSVCTLGTYASGDSIRVAFMAASDANTQGQFQPSWQIDSLQVTVTDSAVTPITVTGIRYGESNNVVCLAVSPDLVPDRNVYYVTAQDVHDPAGTALVPNPTVCSFIHGAEFPSFRILYRRFDDVGNGVLSAFLGSSKFVNNTPDLVQSDPTGFFEAPSNVRENYGAQLLGFARAPVEGDYRFWMSSDDQGVTYIAEDGIPAHKHQINSEPAWGGVRAYTDAGHDNNDNRGVPPVNGSDPIHLLAGQKVYLEGVFTEGGGGDNYACAATINDPSPPPNGATPIDDDFFVPMRRGPRGEVFSRLCEVFCNPGPSDQTVFLGESATFVGAPDGTPPYSFQWKKNGAAIAGATNATYTTPPATAADDGTAYALEISNAFSSTNCSAALQVRPEPKVVQCFARCEANVIHVIYNKPVQLDGTYDAGSVFFNGISYGASQSEVLLAVDPIPPETAVTLVILDVHSLDGNLIVPNPTVCTFYHGFHRYCVDFNDGQLPPGTVSNGTTPPSVGAEGALHLTDRVNSQANYWTVPLASTQNFPFFTARWRTLLEGLGGADGFSFNAGLNLGTAFTPEEGAANGLSVSVDTFDNGGGEVGPEIKWNGARLAFTPAGGGSVNGPPELMKGQFVDASVEVTTGGLVTFKYDTFVLSAQIPNYNGLNVNQYVFAARTGGANENCWIDDLCINDFALTAPTIASGPNDLAVPENSTASFAVTGVDGIPPISYQWLRNGSPIAGATGPTYSFTAVLGDNGSGYSVRLANECGTTTSREASLRVFVPPIVLACDSRGNCRSVYVTYNKPVLLNGVYSVTCSNSTSVALFAENFNGGDGGFTVETPLPYDGPWTYNGGSGSWTQAGQGPESGHPNTSMLRSPPINVNQAGVVQLTFSHRYSFEQDAGTVGWDGGQVRVSVNGGAFTAVPAAAFSQLGYSGTVRANSASDLHGQAAFVVNSPNFTAGTITSACTLGFYAAGDSIRIAFMAASDGNTQGQFQPNWEIDSLQLDSFAVSPLAVTGVAYAESSNVVCLSVSPGLVPYVNTYYVATADVRDREGDTLIPNPSVCALVHRVLPACPADFTVGCASPTGAVVNFTVVASDSCSMATVSCLPPSGSVFPPGTNTVICTTTNGPGNDNACSFVVVLTVQDARCLKQKCLADLAALRAAVTNRQDLEELDDAIDHLTRSLDSKLWVDNSHLQRKGGDKVFEEEKKTVHELVELLKDRKSTVPAAALKNLIDCILRADRLLAVTAVDEAESAGVNPKKIAEDRKEIARGDEDAADGKYEEAIDHYRNAWKHAVKIKITPPRQLPTGAVRLEFVGIEGETYIIQTSANLVDWTTIGTARANSDGIVAIDDPTADWHPTRFYRIVEP